MIERQTKHSIMSKIIRVADLSSLWSEEVFKVLGFLLMIDYFYSDSDIYTYRIILNLNRTSHRKFATNRTGIGENRYM